MRIIVTLLRDLLLAHAIIRWRMIALIKS